MRLTGGQYLCRRSDATGNAACSRLYGRAQPATSRSSAVWGALRSGLSSAGHSPYSTRAISARMATMASQNRSSSSFDSDSVGSTISVPATGNHIVGAWNP